MRYIKLKNSAGVEYDITTKNALFHDIQGLGFSEDGEYKPIGDVWVLNSVSSQQSPISGDICFGYEEDPYGTFNTFANFIRETPLTFLYFPKGLTGKCYRKRVRVSSLEKGELNEYGVLDCPVEFLPQTPWYEEVSRETSASEVDIDTPGWVWGGTSPASIPLVFYPEPARNPDGSIIEPVPDDPAKRRARFRGECIKFVQLESGTSKKNPVRLTLYGPLVNPFWTHYVNGEIVSSGGFVASQSVSIGENEMLVIDNTDGKYSIKVYRKDSTEVLRDVYRLRNFNLPCFFYMQKGSNQFVISSSDGRVNQIRAEGHVYYDTV